MVFDLDLIRNDNGHPDTLDFLIDFEVVLVDNAGSVATFALTDLTEFILERVGGVDLTTGDFDISDLEDLSFEADSDVMFDDPFVVSIEGPGLKFELVAVTRDTDDGGTIMGDPYFFVGSSLYDWKQVRADTRALVWFQLPAVMTGVERVGRVGKGVPGLKGIASLPGYDHGCLRWSGTAVRTVLAGSSAVPYRFRNVVARFDTFWRYVPYGTYRQAGRRDLSKLKPLNQPLDQPQLCFLKKNPPSSSGWRLRPPCL